MKGNYLIGGIIILIVVIVIIFYVRPTEYNNLEEDFEDTQLFEESHDYEEDLMDEYDDTPEHPFGNIEDYGEREEGPSQI